jgi:hypothetical protein
MFTINDAVCSWRVSRNSTSLIYEYDFGAKVGAWYFQADPDDERWEPLVRWRGTGRAAEDPCAVAVADPGEVVAPVLCQPPARACRPGPPSGVVPADRAGRATAGRLQPQVLPRLDHQCDYARSSCQKGFASRLAPAPTAASASGKAKISGPGPSASPARGIFTATFPTHLRSAFQCLSVDGSGGDPICR